MIQRVLAFSLVACLWAYADRTRADIIYPDFASTTGLQLNGNASHVANEIQLTPSSGFQRGSAFTSNQIALGSLNSFSTYFQFRLSNPGGVSDVDGQGADGIVFVIQKTSAGALGGAGSGMGYSGISPSLGIEFDTYKNSAIDPPVDPSGNHVGVDTNGSVTSLVTANEASRFNGGQVWNAWVDYDGSTDQLQVRWSLSNIRPLSSQLSTTINLATLLGQNTAFLGFTGATGSGYNTQDILSWQFRDRFSPIDAVPEPSTLVLLGAGLACLFAKRAKRRKRAGNAAGVTVC